MEGFAGPRVRLSMRQGRAPLQLCLASDKPCWPSFLVKALLASAPPTVEQATAIMSPWEL